MNGYELLVLLRPDLDEKIQEETVAKLKKTIEEQEGKILDVADWGKKPLSYPIKRFPEALYFLLDLQMPAPAVAKVDHFIRIQEEIIRHLLVKKEEIRDKKQVTRNKK